MNADGSNQINLTQDNANDIGPIWSHDGSKIAFASLRDLGTSKFEIYVMDANGSNRVRLTSSNSSNSLSQVWSPDDSKIAFRRDSNPDNLDSAGIYIMNADGSNQVRLSQNRNDAKDLTWSPDGSKIAFQSIRSVAPTPPDIYEEISDIYIMNADGSNQVNLTQNSGYDFTPIWSPDGSKIAFQSLRNGLYGLYVMNTDGSNQVNLTQTRSRIILAAWSPDSSKIAFSSDSDEGYTQIYVINADGSNPVNLTQNSFSNYSPAWSP